MLHPAERDLSIWTLGNQPEVIQAAAKIENFIRLVGTYSIQ